MFSSEQLLIGLYLACYDSYFPFALPPRYIIVINRVMVARDADKNSSLQRIFVIFHDIWCGRKHNKLGGIIYREIEFGVMILRSQSNN